MYFNFQLKNYLLIIFILVFIYNFTIKKYELCFYLIKEIVFNTL